jgi:hypothetical protein
MISLSRAGARTKEGMARVAPWTAKRVVATTVRNFARVHPVVEATHPTTTANGKKDGAIRLCLRTIILLILLV